MSRFLKESPAWGISLIINLSILGVFHFIVYDELRQPDVNTISSVVDDIVPEQELNFTEAIQTDVVGNDGMAASLTPTLKSATTLAPEETPLQDKLEEVLNPEVPQLSETMLVDFQTDVSSLVDVKGQSDDAAGGVEGAMDRVAYEIRQSLKERKTLVIWLFDASGSLEDRRQRIADRFQNIYSQLGKTGTTDGLYTAVVSFGQSRNLLTEEPIQDVAKLRQIVEHGIATDESGDENVFGTVKLVLEKFRMWKRNEGPWNKMVFIVTDERGDDVQYLEEAIMLAKRTQTRVYTIGNAAVLGQQHGYVRHTYDDGESIFVPVDQGPETAFPDGLQLPFVGSGRNWKQFLPTASYGPYGLSRLCAETGGLYLITDQKPGADFERVIMRRYAPDYRPIAQQQAEIFRNPAKAALVNVAQMTYDDELPVPQLEFRAYNDNILRNEITDAQQPVAEIDFALRRMYDVLVTGEKARDTLHDERWRATFDLAMGRLLAMRVRYHGYNQMLANMKVSPKTFEKENSNMWRLVPSSEIETGPEIRKAAEMARTYLNRVIDEHSGTPWALLAERELSTELGWSWEEFSRPIPGSDQLRGSDEEVARLLLADEERRQEMRRQQPTQNRQVPKL